LKFRPFYTYLKYSFVLLVLIASGCALEKKSAFNRTMQNLTAHYNIIYNANDLLYQTQTGIAFAYVDSYDEILTVYPDPTIKTVVPNKDLDAIITRANTIISVKEQSHYLGDAYFLLGKANYLKGNYYNAIEFFNYVSRSFADDKKQKDLVQDAKTWKARALLKIDQPDSARVVLDTAFNNLFPKQKDKAGLYAAKLQYDINAEKYEDAEQMATKAIYYTKDKSHRLRWTFILAQLQELNRKPKDAYLNYTKVVNSNASFEMAFNAALNRIRIEDVQSGHNVSRVDRLRSLLSDEKNKDFTDQIYYQIGELYLAQGNVDEAIKNYKLSVRSSTKNLNQKGISYLRIADVYFKNKNDYIRAKKYYDSTLTSLQPTYPGYLLIQRKSNNLQLLADRLQIITREDTLQMLAALNDKDRRTRIEQMVKARLIQQQQAQAAAASSNVVTAAGSGQTTTGRVGGTGTNSTFYLYNPNALSQGYTDFKRVWGNRALGDNWRRSTKAPETTNSAPVSAIIQSISSTAQPDQTRRSADSIALNTMRQDIVEHIPLTQVQLAQSNAMVYNAYLDIANFYRDILDDRKEAISNFELLLTRFPDNPNKAVIYYNLYRLYSTTNTALSDKYKNLLIKEFPETNFARIITDPDFNQKLNDQNAEFTAFYNDLYTLYASKNYQDVSNKADGLIKQFPGNPLLAQVYYLRAIARGHQEKLDPFRTDLQEIIDKFPNDRLITPLVKQHLVYIKANEALIAQRKFAVVDNDPNEVPYVQQQIAVNRPAAPAQVKPPTPIAPAITKPVIKQPATANVLVPKPQPVQPPGNKTPVIPAAPVEPPSIFSLKDSTNYYFVINVNNGNVNLAPSRFGIGQFNRANFQGNNIRHQLKPVENNQLIYVGHFNSLEAVKAYARGIAPLLPDIMKVPAGQYTVFIITQQNLDKVTDKKTLDSYFDFYQRKY
jgi:tetratricopeptide (TPR) repeat protein